LFWKKNNDDSEMFTYETNSRRNSFRTCPSEDEPIILKIGEKEVDVNDIGAKGLSFKNNNFKAGGSHPVKFKLPGRRGVVISVVLKIIRISDQNICHCLFINMQEDAEEAIHQYVLAKQKEDLS
tara:strand:- start:128 stop:499 length:372 start_codon:yes stop_codon:yes gene_type:complete